MKKQETSSRSINNNGLSTFQALSFAWQMGYILAIPIVLFALGGRLLDNHYQTSPLFLLIGILFSIVVSSVALWQKAIQIINNVEKEYQTNQSK